MSNMGFDNLLSLADTPLAEIAYIREKYGGTTSRVSYRKPKGILADPNVSERLKNLIMRVFAGRLIYIAPAPAFKGEHDQRLSETLVRRYQEGESVYRFAVETGRAYPDADRLAAGRVGLTEEVRDGWVEYI